MTRKVEVVETKCDLNTTTVGERPLAIEEKLATASAVL